MADTLVTDPTLLNAHRSLQGGVLAAKRKSAISDLIAPSREKVK